MQNGPYLDQEPEIDVLRDGLGPTDLPVLVVSDVDSLITKIFKDTIEFNKVQPLLLTIATPEKDLAAVELGRHQLPRQPNLSQYNTIMAVVKFASPFSLPEDLYAGAHLKADSNVALISKEGRKKIVPTAIFGLASSFLGNLLSKFVEFEDQISILLPDFDLDAIDIFISMILQVQFQTKQ